MVLKCMAWLESHCCKSKGPLLYVFYDVPPLILLSKLLYEHLRITGRLPLWL